MRWNRTATYTKEKEKMKKKQIEFPISCSEVSHLIDEWCFNEKHRAILKRRWIDGIGQEELAEEFDLSVRQIQYIIYKQGDKVLRHVPF